MSNKQVKETIRASVMVPAPANTSESNGNNPKQNNLYISVETFNPKGKSIGFRIVDLFHYNTRNWLQTHLWWAMHNSNCVEVNTATPEQIDEYLQDAKLALAKKYDKGAGDEPVIVEAVPAAVAA